MSFASRSNEILTLGDDSLPLVKVHATAAFGILSGFSRRAEKQSRVIGTLLGIIKDGEIEITDCFGVPHLEKSDELYVAINKDYHKSMYNFHRMVNRREQIVGWFTTTTADGELVTDNSSLIHEFYSNECPNPVHVVLDTTLQGETMGLKAYFSEPLVVGEYTFANMFNEAPLEVVLTDAESSCLFHMLQPQPSNWPTSTVVAAIPAESALLRGSLERLLLLVDEALSYVTEVTEGSRPPVVGVGIALSDLVSTLQSIRPEDFHSLFQNKLQDLLMVAYLTTLTQTQLAVAEKVNAIL